MNDGDDYGFWDADRERSLTGPIPRLKRASESARTSPARAHRMDAPLVGPRRTSRGPNPLHRRLAALFAAAVIALPVAWLMRGSDDPAQIKSAQIEGAQVSSVEVAADPGLVLPATMPPASVALAVEVAATVAVSSATAAAALAPVVAETTAVVETSEAAARVESAPANSARSVGVATPVVETKRVCAIDYEVAAGDYWISIAKRSDVKLADLLEANGAKVSTPLYPGRSICLPAGATVPATTDKPTPTTTAKPTATTAKPTPTTTKPKSTATTTKPASTTPPTTVAPSTTEPPPANHYSRAEVEQIIRNVWPDDLEDEAVRIATRESNLIPTVRNSCCYGLFQIYFNANKASLVAMGVTSASRLYDPQVNAYVAYAMYLRSGWGPWAL